MGLGRGADRGAEVAWVLNAVRNRNFAARGRLRSPERCLLRPTRPWHAAARRSCVWDSSMAAPGSRASADGLALRWWKATAGSRNWRRWCLHNSNASSQPRPATRCRLYRPQLQLHDSALQASKFCMERNVECCLNGGKWREEVGDMVEAAEKTMRRAGEVVSARGGSQGRRDGLRGEAKPRASVRTRKRSEVGMSHTKVRLSKGRNAGGRSVGRIGCIPG